MKVLPYYLYEKINEIKFGNTKPFEYEDFQIKEDIYWVDIEIESNRIFTIELNFLEYDDIVFSKNKKLNSFLKENQKEIDGNLSIINFYEWNKEDGRNFTDFGETVNDFKTLFKKMETIFSVIKDFQKIKNIKWFIFESAENDPLTGLEKEYNKRDKFYDTYLKYYNIFNIFINKTAYIKSLDLYLKNFYLVNK